MPYETSGSLTTDSREVAVDTTWDSQTDWEAYQSATNVAINNGVVELAQAGSTIVDSFEDQDLAEYGGATGEFSFTSDSSFVTEGSVALTSQSAPSSTTGISSTGGLPAYPSAGDTVAWDMEIQSGDANSGMMFAIQTAGSIQDGTLSGYHIRLNHAASTFQLYRVDSGSFTLLAEAGAQTSSRLRRYEFEWGSGGSLAARVYEGTGDSATLAVSVSATDSTYTSGGVGVRLTSSTSTLYLDNVRILQ